MKENSTSNDFLKDDEFNLDDAWLRMRETLDRELPVQQESSKKRLLYWWTRMAAMLIIGIAIAVFTVNVSHTDNTVGKIEDDRSIESKANDKHENSVAVDNTTAEKKDVVKKQIAENREGITKYKRPLQPKSSSNGFYNPRIKEPLNPSTFTLFNQAEKLLLSTNFSLQSHLQIVNNRPVDSIRTPVAAAPVKRYRRAGVELGVLYNAGTELTNVYPVVKYHVPVNEKISISAGVALQSPVAIKDLTVKEFIVLNDTANQVYFNVRSTSVKKITYLDLPVQVHYAINKKWSVSAGLQLSVLQESNSHSQNKSYDFMSNPAQQVTMPLWMTALQPYQTYMQEYELAKTNWRVLAGASYHFGKTAVTVQYQGSLSKNYSVKNFSGETTSTKLSVMTVGVSYKF
jgi:hypothetical protein